MEISKYIGQFLIKNTFCYIHGLGNMELVKRPAMHDGKTLQAPVYEIVVTAGGSIDDSFANFIATNEQISISKAANALRDFSMSARKDMAAGKEVQIPGLGKFTEENGRIHFYTDPGFRYAPAGIPVLKNSKQLEDQKITPSSTPSFPRPANANSVNWNMVILAGVLLLILGGGGYGYYYYKSQQKVDVPLADTLKADTVIQAPQPLMIDTALPAKDTMAAPAIDTNTVNTYKMIIGEYTGRDKAEKRFRQLKINGSKVELQTKDSINFQVTTTVNCRVVDTIRAKDSLQKLFGYKNVMITN